MRPCPNCPIKNTEYCHLVNPEAKKLARQEKEKIAEMMRRQRSTNEQENQATRLR